MNPPGIPLPTLPDRIASLSEIATNLSWNWSRDARVLFRAIDPVLWHQTRHNPIAVLQQAPPARLEECAADPAFLMTVGDNAYPTGNQSDYGDLNGGNVFPAIGQISAQDLLAQTVQKMIVDKQSPADAVKWGQDQMTDAAKAAAK